jgi:Asp-tRNA(Asn)/Glu-tRNA(Gln) amidotransferase A subunit family amidase
VPSGTVADVPVGTTFVGEYFDEGTLFALGSALEKTVET